jgi:transposase
MSRQKFVQSISDAVRISLQECYATHSNFRVRQRAHAILLSSKGYTITQLQEIFEVDRDTISVWIDRFEAQGIAGLEDKPRPGRPSIYTDEELNQLKDLVDNEPRQLKQAQAILQQNTEKTSCRETLKRALKKKLKYTWHRCRRSLKSKRDQEAFEQAQDTQQTLETLAAMDKINVYYFDESGFSTVPCVPYAWQPRGEVREIPSFPSKRLNVLGFMSKKQKTYFHTVEGSVTAQEVIAAFEGFTLTYSAEYANHNKPCVVVLDNASTHTSNAFLDQLEKWASRGVILLYLPPYSPELNRIEILWQKIKYSCLSLDCYLSYDNLKKSVLSILDGVGSEYLITFV